MSARCRLCRRLLRCPSADGLGPVCRRRTQPTVQAPLLDLPAAIPPASGQLAFDDPPPEVPCNEWPAPGRLDRRTVTVPGPDTWNPNPPEEAA